MTISFEIKGREQMQRAFRMLGEKGPKAMGDALWREGNRIMTDAKAITPVDTGVLKQSGHVTTPIHRSIDTAGRHSRQSGRLAEVGSGCSAAGHGSRAQCEASFRVREADRH